MKKILIYLREHSAHLLKEKSSERLHGTIDIILYTFTCTCQLFTVSDLSSPSHRVPCSHPVGVRATALNIRMRNVLMEKNIS